LNKPILYIFRHGSTDWSDTLRHTGRTDLELNSKGLEKARKAKEALGDKKFEKVYSSPLQRALKTAEIMCPDNQIITDPLLVEWDYGKCEGLTTDEIQKDVPGWLLWKNGVVGGEDIKDVADRADKFLNKIFTQNASIAVFSHGHFLRILTTRWIGISAHEAQYLKLDPCTLSVLGYEHEYRAIQIWNAPLIKD
jgi:broad specificity phosphatase PhoE